MITAIITLSIIFWLFYYLFIKGTIWPILLLIFGVYGGRLLIIDHFPSSKSIIMTFMHHDVCYATFAAALISILAIGTIMERVNE